MVARVDLTTTDTAAAEDDRWKLRLHSKLRKHLAARTFSWVTADVRGVASVEQPGIEHEIEFTAADRTKVDLDGAAAYISVKTPSMRAWMTAEGL